MPKLACKVWWVVPRGDQCAYGTTARLDNNPRRVACSAAAQAIYNAGSCAELQFFCWESAETTQEKNNTYVFHTFPAHYGEEADDAFSSRLPHLSSSTSSSSPSISSSSSPSPVPSAADAVAADAIAAAPTLLSTATSTTPGPQTYTAAASAPMPGSK